jgi:hypothetical protein
MELQASVQAVMTNAVPAAPVATTAAVASKADLSDLSREELLVRSLYSLVLGCLLIVMSVCRLK